MDSNVAHYVEVAIVMLLGIVGWFLRHKDEQQAKEMAQMREHYDRQVTALWAKHDEDANKLAVLQSHIDKEHYVKSELDNRFDRLERTFERGMENLGKKFDKLTDAFIAHASNEDKREEARLEVERTRATMRRSGD